MTRRVVIMTRSELVMSRGSGSHDQGNEGGGHDQSEEGVGHDQGRREVA